MCSVEITDKDPTFDWVRKYMKEEGMIKEEGFLKVTKKYPDDGEEAWINRSNDKAKPEVEYNQGGGTYIVTFQGRKLWIDHWEGKTEVTGWNRQPNNRQFMCINAYGTDT